MDKDVVILRHVENTSKFIKLNDGSAIALGRNRETQITDTRCSRNQLLITANLKLRELEIEQLGNNPSGLNGDKMKKGEKRKAHHNDVIEVLLSEHQFKVEFPPISNVISNGDTKNNESEKELKNSGLLDHFLKNSALKKVGSWETVHQDSLYVFSSDGLENRNKIASFDLDGTIITTISGNVYPKDTSDWKLAYPNVIEQLRKLNNDGYKIVFFTNQGGIGSGRIKIADFKKKIEAIVRKIGIPIQAYVSGASDINRKPRPGMWATLKNKNDAVEIDKNSSFFVGDAAGRPANSEPNKKKKDFSSSDRLFAMNLGVKFYTPEEYFLGWKQAPFKLPDFNPMTLIKKPLLEPETTKLISDSVEIIVMIGSPASGKSFFSKKYLCPAGYVHVNRDTLKTWQKCVKLTEENVKNKKSVVVDNTSPDKESRARYTKIGKEYNIPVRAFWMNTSLEHAKHNNVFRKLTDTTHDVIQNYALHSFAMEPPELSEGFTEIVHVNFIPEFENEELKNLYQMYLLDS